MVSPTGGPEWPAHPQLGTKSHALGSFAGDCGLCPKGNEIIEDFSQRSKMVGLLQNHLGCYVESA